MFKPLKLWPLLPLTLMAAAPSQWQLADLSQRAIEAFMRGDYGRARLRWQKAAGDLNARHLLGELFRGGYGVALDDG